MERDLVDDGIKVIYIIFLVLIIIFTILLIVVYIKDRNLNIKTNDSNKLQLYPFYFNVFFCVIIVIENAIRLIPESIGVDPSYEKGEANFFCSLQAISASLFDKLLLSNMTIYSIVNFLCVFLSDFYKNHLKQIYITSILVGFAFSLGLTIAYAREGISYKDMVCSIHTRTNLKIISDSIYTSILFAINLFCLISLIIYLYLLRKSYKKENKKDQYKKSSDFFYRFLFDLLINIGAYIYILLSVNKVFARGTYKDIIYILIGLTVELFFTLNRTLFEAFIRTVTCNKYHLGKKKLIEIGPDRQDEEKNVVEEYEEE